MTSVQLEEVDAKVILYGEDESGNDLTDEYKIISLECAINPLSTPNNCDVRVYLPDDKVETLTSATKMEVYIKGTLVYAGVVRSVAYLENGHKVLIRSSDFTKELNERKFTSNYAEQKEDGIENPDDEPIGSIAENIVSQTIGQSFDDITYDDVLIKNFETDRTVIETSFSLRETGELYPYNTLSEDSPNYDEVTVTVGLGEDVENYGIKFDVSETSGAQALTELADIHGGIWYVSYDNKLVFGRPRKEDLTRGSGSDNKNPFQLENIKKREDESNFIPYRGVKVIGSDNSGLSENNEYTDDDGNIQIIEDFDNEKSELGQNYVGIVFKKGNKPYYVYEDKKQIDTAEKARVLGRKIYQEKVSESISGEVEVVASEAQNLGAYEPVRYPEEIMNSFYKGRNVEDPPIFMSRGLKHIINNDDGFITKVRLSGLTPLENIRDNSNEEISRDAETSDEDTEEEEVEGIRGRTY